MSICYVFFFLVVIWMQWIFKASFCDWWLSNYRWPAAPVRKPEISASGQIISYSQNKSIKLLRCCVLWSFCDSKDPAHFTFNCKDRLLNLAMTKWQKQIKRAVSQQYLNTSKCRSYPACSLTQGPSCFSVYFHASPHPGSLSHLLPMKTKKKKRAAFTLLISSGFNHESISSVA